MGKKKKEGKSDFLLEALHLPTDIVHKDSILTFLGNKTLKIENYRNIIWMSDEHINIQCKPYKIYVCGKRLKIQYYDKEEMEIIGKIEVIRFE